MEQLDLQEIYLQCAFTSSSTLHHSTQILPGQQYSAGPVPGHFWYMWIPPVPDMGRIWADTM